MKETYYVLALIVCTSVQCFQHRLYSSERYKTKEECNQAPVVLERHRADTDLMIRCMTEEEYAKLPKE